MRLEENESFWDRMIRAVVGLILFYLGIAGVVQGVVGIVLLILGAILLVTAALGFCPIYQLLHIRTNHKETPES
jgi:hypothetical protein